MLRQEIDEMKAMAERLVPLTFPLVKFTEEQEVLLLKQRTVVVDGYPMLLCYSKADYEDYLLESLQVQSSYSPFLPFWMVCKVGRAFLGRHHLAFVEFFKNHRKVYCWMAKSRDGRRLHAEKNTVPASYEGFRYYKLNPNEVEVF